MKYFDIHTHVNFAAFNDDRDLVIKRALDTGVGIVNVGTQKDTSAKAVALAEKYENGVYAIVGLHPIHTGKSFHDEKELGPSFAPASPRLRRTSKATEGKAGGEQTGFTSRGEVYDISYYRQLAKHPKVVGIGECGLDFYRENQDSGFKIQEKIFLQHIELANEVRKPLMLHVRSGSGRSAYLDAAEILKREAKVPFNFHFFVGSLDETKLLLDLGATFSFTGVITFTKDYDEVIRYLPLERIMSETDAPYVTPAPHRGRRNEPTYVIEVVKRIAEIRGEDFEKVRSQLVQNTRDFFSLP